MMKKFKVLLIDDDDLFLYLTERTLKKVSCLEEINSINDVRDAQAYLISCVARHDPFPDAIFVDMNMPGMNGMEFADLYSQEFLNLYPDTKLVMLTSSISRKEKAQAMEIPSVSGFMEKPLTEEKLNRILL